VPRFRLFAGPNGSGKSTLYEYLRRRREIHTEIYISADRIEADLRRKSAFSFNAYRVRVSEAEFLQKVQNSALLTESQRRQYIRQISLRSGELRLNRLKPDSYLASLIADYLVSKLFLSKQSFCYETVMSHPSKIEVLSEAVKSGYRTYLYFVFTQDPALNQLRVLQRVQQGGHAVPALKIIERFYRSMRLLRNALAYADKAYLIDNSKQFETVAIKESGVIKWLTKEVPEILARNLKSR